MERFQSSPSTTSACTSTHIQREEVELADRGLAGLDNSLFVRWQWFDTVHEETLPAQPVTTVLSATEATYEAIDLAERSAQLRA